MSAIKKSVVVEPHKRIKNKSVTITTVVKSNKTKFQTKEIKMIGEQLLKRAKKGSKIMVKVLSSQGYFTLKSYDDTFEAILDEDEYLNGRENIGEYKIYKASFFVI